MPRDFTLPDLGEGLTEAEIVKVLVREGDVIAEDAPLLEVETTRRRWRSRRPWRDAWSGCTCTPGQTVKVGAVLVSFADAAASRRGPARAAAAPKPAPAASAEPAGYRRARRRGARRARRRAGAGAPSTRRLARELKVDLATVAGSGPGGRITDDDVRAAARRGPRRTSRAAATPRRRAPGGGPRLPGPREPLAPVVAAGRRPCRASSSGVRWSACRSRISAAPSRSAWRSRRRSFPT
jgi:pyruvate dehydrogenase E2 component (dihydrolipoamide acetyltransferase)